MINNEKFDILGVKVSAVNMSDACAAIENAIMQNMKIYICICPVNTIMWCQKNEYVQKSVNSAALVTADGMPVVWVGRMKGVHNIQKVSGTDLMLEICNISEKKGYKNYFYGSTPVVLASLKEKLRTKFSNLKITGFYSPPFSEEFKNEDKEIIDIINNSNSDILWVGIGCPKQEVWMFRHRDKLNVPVLVGVGAVFDFMAGRVKRAPKWIQYIGLEWLFRLIQEPRRLWKRYLVGNTIFIYLIFKELVKKLIARGS